VVTVRARRHAASYLRSELGLSQRHACGLVKLHRSTSRYARQRGEDKELRERLRVWAARHPRWGYRFLHWALTTKEGWKVNRKKIYRLYGEEGLRIRRRRRKRVATAPRERLVAPMRANQRWSMDFMSDELEDGRSLRLLNLVDDFTRECPAILVDRSLPAERVTEQLERLAQTRGLPETIVVDNGPEFASKELHRWAYQRRVELHFIEPGNPVQNAFIESFNGTCRDDCLNAHVFTSVEDARRKIERWRRHYNHQRPHSSLGHQTPADFARRTRGLCPRTPV
jgi:putative transposase